MTRDVHLFLLAHHGVADRDHCVCLPIGRRRVALCARCLGLYPALLVTLLLQLWGRSGPAGAIDWWIALAGAAPAVLDWGLGRLRRRGSNAVRLLTGGLLGVALGRSLLLYLRDPRNELFWVQMLLIGCAVVAFEAVRRMRLFGD